LVKATPGTSYGEFKTQNSKRNRVREDSETLYRRQIISEKRTRFITGEPLREDHSNHASRQNDDARYTERRELQYMMENSSTSRYHYGARSEETVSLSLSQNTAEMEEESVQGNEDEVHQSNDTLTSYEMERHQVALLNGVEESLSSKAIKKRDLLRLGPARVVGMRRVAADKPPLLKEIERPRAVGEAEGSNENKNSVCCSHSVSSRTSDTRKRPLDEDSMGAITVESIPPPPTHDFSLSHVTSISNLLSSPNQFLSTHHGGDRFESALKFNLLALVMRIGGIEDAPDWKAGGGKRMDRCEMIIKDASECAIKIVLEGDCATRWAAPREEEGGRGTESLESVIDQSHHSDGSSDKYCNSLEASISAFQDASTSASRTTIERQKDDRLLPLRPGDVIVLSRLYLVRLKQLRHRSSSSRYSDDSKAAASTHAIASSSSNAQVELCWRNSIHHERDQRRNFDKCLVAFDARCKAIYRLAQAWTASDY